MKKITLSNRETLIIPKLKKKKWLDDPNMDFIISHQPDVLNKELLETDSKFSYNIIVNSSFFKRTSKNNLIEIIEGVIAIIIGFLIMYFFNFNGGLLIVAGCIIFPGVLSLILAITKPSKDFILDRLNGLMAYPNSWWYKPIVTRFEDSSVVLLYEGKLQNPTLKALTKGFWLLHIGL